jgi:hypothetical protein
MKKLVLVLLVLLSLISVAPSMAQTPAAPPASDADARFLATLSAGQTQSPGDLVPAPLFMTGCAGTYQCPTGELCCYMCGNPPEGDDSGCWMCVTPWKGRCPLVV